MKSLELYARHYVAAQAHERICKDLKKAALRELRRMPAEQKIIFGVELCVTNKTQKTYATDIQECIDKYNKMIDEQKEIALKAGKVTEKSTPTIKATIPKSIAKTVLATVRDYAKYFGIK